VIIDNPGNKKTEETPSIRRDHAYDTRIRETVEAKQKQICKPVTKTSSGNTFTEESGCTVQGSVVTSKVVSTFTGGTAFHSKTHGTYKPGMEPGDFMSADGQVTHVKRP